MLVEKTFIKVLPLVFSDTKKLKSYRKDKRISQSEKKIIESWLLVKLGKNKEAIELLESLKGELSEVVQGQLYLLKAFCSLNLTAFSEAIVLFKKAEPLINKLNLKRYNFSLYYNLHETYSNIGDTEGMKWCHQLILDNISTDVEKKSYEMALASLYLKLEDTKSAFKALNTIKESYETLSAALKQTFLIKEFFLRSKIEDWSGCEQTLSEYKKIRQFKVTSNYLFMKILVLKAKYNKSVYAYKKDFKNAPFLFHQLSVIKYIEAQDFKSAQEHWEELQIVDPLSYQADFSYHGEKNIFSYCLEQSISVPLESQKGSFLPKDKVIGLIDLLKKSVAPISRENLFLKLWGREIESYQDEVMFKNTLYRARKMNATEIKYKKGCYNLEKAS